MLPSALRYTAANPHGPRRHVFRVGAHPGQARRACPWRSRAAVAERLERDQPSCQGLHATTSYLSGPDVAAELVGNKQLPMRPLSTHLRDPGGSLPDWSRAIPLAAAEVLRQMVSGDARLIDGTPASARLRARPCHRETHLASRVLTLRHRGSRVAHFIRGGRARHR